MVKRGVPILCALIACLQYAAACQQQEEHKQEVARARGLLHLLVDEKYDAFIAECNERVQAALPVEKLKEIWTATCGMFGGFVEETGTSATAVGKSLAVSMECEFKSGRLKAVVTLDENGKVAGFRLLPSTSPVAYEPPPYVDTSKFHETEVTVSVGDFALPGTLTIPNGDGPFPGVVLVHGSGSLAGDRDETVFSNTKPFKDLAWGLGTRGVAVLRYEKRTYKYPNMAPATITIETETVDDALAAARLLLARAEIDRQRVFVAGHSQGAMAAPYIASQEPRIAGLVMLAAPARSFFEIGVEEAIRLALQDGIVTEAELTQIEQAREIVQAWREGTWKPDEDTPAAPLSYWVSTYRLVPVLTAKSLHIPILIVQGGRDIQVLPETDYLIWKRALAAHKNATLKYFDRMDHLFHPGDGPSSLDQYKEKGYVDVALVECLAEWIQSAR
jgi:dienelactone hydrolase